MKSLGTSNVKLSHTITWKLSPLAFMIYSKRPVWFSVCSHLHKTNCLCPFGDMELQNSGILTHIYIFFSTFIPKWPPFSRNGKWILFKRKLWIPLIFHKVCCDWPTKIGLGNAIGLGNVVLSHEPWTDVGLIYWHIYASTSLNEQRLNTHWGSATNDHCDGLMQERQNSSALAMELCLSCTNQLHVIACLCDVI